MSYATFLHRANIFPSTLTWVGKKLEMWVAMLCVLCTGSGYANDDCCGYVCGSFVMNSNIK